jgi:hypothetical protein
MRATFLEADSPEWPAALSALEHDFYHLPGYVRLSARHEGGEPLAFLAEEDGHRFLVPLILRPVGGGGGEAADAISPYGYPSPLLSPPAGAEGFLARALARFVEGLRERRVVSCFVRLHPLLGLPLDLLGEWGCVVKHGETVWVDLALPPEEIWHQTKRAYRQHIDHGRREGQQAEMDPTWEAFDDFVDIYQENMRRVKADPSFLFSREYFLGLREALGARLHLWTVRVGGEVAAAALFTEVRGIVQYHLCGTRAAFVKVSPTKALVHHARLWARERGNRALHLGGGVGGRADSLFAFKAGFSHLRSPFHTWRVIVDPPGYRALTRQWECRSGLQADAPDGFFPAYRKAVPPLR